MYANATNQWYKLCSTCITDSIIGVGGRKWRKTASGGSGSMVYPGAGVPLSTGSAWGTSYQALNNNTGGSLVLRDGSGGIQAADLYSGDATIDAFVSIGQPSSNTNPISGQLIFKNSASTFTQTFKGSNPGANITYVLPTTAPTAGQVLSSTAPSAGVATMSWATPGGGGTVTGGSITWPGTIYTTPTTGTVSSGTLTFAPALTTQPANTIFGNNTGSTAAPTFFTNNFSDSLRRLPGTVNVDRRRADGTWITQYTDSVGSGGGGVTTVGTFSPTAITNGASIAGTTLTLGVGDSTKPGMISTIDQTSAGVKSLQNVYTNTTSTQFTRSSSQYFYTPSTAALQAATLTLAGWVYIDAKNVAQNYIIASKDDDSSFAGSEYLMGYVGSYDRFIFQVETGVGANTRVDTAKTFGSPSIGTWNYVVGWYSSTTNRCYIQINNGAVDSVSAAGTLHATSTPFTIGANRTLTGGAGGLGSWMNGKLSQIGFWQRVLTTAERTSLFNNGNGLLYYQLSSGVKTTMLSWWDLHSGSGTDGQGVNNLTAVNTPTIGAPPGASVMTTGGISVGYTGSITPNTGMVMQGNLGINTTLPFNRLTIDSAVTKDTLAEAMITPSATTRKGLVIQGKASQTANLLEFQASNGNVIGGIYPTTTTTSIRMAGAATNGGAGSYLFDSPDQSNSSLFNLSVNSQMAGYSAIVTGKNGTGTELPLALGGFDGATFTKWQTFDITGKAGFGLTVPLAKVDIAAGSLADARFGLRVVGTLPSGTTTTFGRLVDIQATSINNTSNAYAFNMDFLAGATDANFYSAGRFANAAAGTGTTGVGVWGNPSNNGLVANATATTAGANMGATFMAQGGSTSIGSQSISVTTKNSATNIGVLGLGLNAGTSPIQIGGYFGLQATTPTFASAAGVFDNGAVAAPIALFRDNGTTQVAIVDGGAVAIGAATATDKLEVTGNIALMAAGNKIKITTGTNASAGTATLSGGTVTVSTTAVTANSLIFLTDATTGALTNIGTPTVGTKTAGTSFVINSTNVLDASVVNWIIIN